MGTQNRVRMFNLVALMISSEETESAYTFFLESVKTRLNTIWKINYTPKFVMSDGAIYIFNAVENIFGRVEHLMCYYHAKTAVEKKLRSLRLDEKIVKSILKDLDNLRDVSFIVAFEKLLELTLKRWEKISLEFTNYFIDEYTKSKRYRWSYAYIEGNIPNTNNGMEGFNRSIKYQHSNRIALSFRKYLKFISGFLQFKSKLSCIYLKRPRIKPHLWDLASKITLELFLKSNRKELVECYGYTQVNVN
jgi:hypothetical protein